MSDKPIIQARWTTKLQFVSGFLKELKGRADDATLAVCQQLLAEDKTQQPGRVGEYYTIDQFHAAFKPMVNRYNAPNAFCGATAPVNALTLSELFASVFGSEPLQAYDVDLVMDVANASLCDVQAIEARVDTTLKTYHDWRKAYVERFPAKFKSKADANSYMKNWIANYEISDHLRQYCAATRNSSSTSRLNQILFVRANQWPIRHEATLEEYDRMEEEERFGGKASELGVDFDAEKGERSVIIEIPNKKLLLKPDEWMSQHARATPYPRIAVVDLQGHYAVALCFKSAGGVPTTIHFNTMGPPYIQHHMLLLTHALLAVGPEYSPAAAKEAEVIGGVGEGGTASQPIELE